MASFGRASRGAKLRERFGFGLRLLNPCFQTLELGESGAIQVKGESLNLTEMAVTDSVAIQGGGINVDSGSLVVENSTISGNSISTGSGGGRMQPASTTAAAAPKATKLAAADTHTLCCYCSCSCCS